MKIKFLCVNFELELEVRGPGFISGITYFSDNCMVLANAENFLTVWCNHDNFLTNVGENCDRLYSKSSAVQKYFVSKNLREQHDYDEQSFMQAEVSATRKMDRIC